MKNALYFLAFALATTLAFSCKQAPEGEKVTASEAKTETKAATGETYAVNTASSNIMWTGSKPTGEHTGNIKISEGKLMVDGGALTGGKFTIDMASLDVTDLEGDYKADLEGHLKSGDFFNVSENPTSTFTITSVEQADGTNPEVTHNITGNLTMMGQTKSVTIPANVVIANNMISAVTPAFTINRTDWGVKYGSGLIGTAQDKLIHDEIGLVINLQAKAAQM